MTNRIDRRAFIASASAALSGSTLVASFSSAETERSPSRSFERAFETPPREFTLMPFWFWNDELSKDELSRQLDEFESRGVYGFTIHPRIGLPEDCGWMSAKLLDFMRFALEEARRRKMRVLLYDEGMYPSGSSAGQVVAENSSYAARGLLKVELDASGAPKDAVVEEDWNLIEVFERADGSKAAVYDAPSKGVIRGLHYLGDENNRPGEFSPPAADLLNPDAVDCFVRLVYQRYWDEFAEYFRDGTIVGIFTDEPSILGRGPRRGMKIGNLRSLPLISAKLGYDFKPHLLDLWESGTRESGTRRVAYERAARLVLEDVYYGKLSEWCASHETSLCGHPEGSADVGVLRKFQIPGQDIVWRYIEPGAKAFDPTHSALAKVASSAMVHNGARRNLNEIFGAYGHELTYEEMRWLIDWCVVRGQNMFVPHAFYYSTRGPRLEERPPDVGPNSPWWSNYKEFADYCARLCWLNTEFVGVAPTAILVNSDVATTRGTRTLLREQIDFNYLELRALADATFEEDALVVGKGRYKALLVPPGANPSESERAILSRFSRVGLVLRMTSGTAEIEGARVARNDDEMIAALRERLGFEVATHSPDGEPRPLPRTSAPGLRVRRVRSPEAEGGRSVDFYFLFNEEESAIDALVSFAADEGDQVVRRWNPTTGEITPVARDSERPRLFRLVLAPRQTTIMAFERREA